MVVEDGPRREPKEREKVAECSGVRSQPARTPIVPTNQEIRIQGAEAQDEDRDRGPAR